MTLFLLVISVGLSLIYGLVFTNRPISWPRTIIKVLPLTALAVFSLLLGGPSLLTIGLALGAVGDGFLSRAGDKPFLIGLGSFLVGHVCFAVLFYQFGLGFSILADAPWRLAVLIGMVGLTVLVRQKIQPKLGKLSVPVHVYIAVIFIMGLTALTLPTDSTLAYALWGAMMFIASDAILSFELFVLTETSRIKKLSAPLLWFLYWGGQFLIAASLLRLIA